MAKTYTHKEQRWQYLERGFYILNYVVCLVRAMLLCSLQAHVPVISFIGRGIGRGMILISTQKERDECKELFTDLFRTTSKLTGT